MRAILIVLDSVGIGSTRAAHHYGDDGAATLGHNFDHEPDLKLSQLDSLGLRLAHQRKDTPTTLLPGCAYGWMQPASKGKETSTGHWEIAGAITEEPFATFTKFPRTLLGLSLIHI